MRLEHTVRVPAEAGEVWRFLDDIHAVAACMPGAELTEQIDGSTFQGLIKITIGPLSMNYTGEVVIVERDDADRRMRLEASGRDRRGSGTARATVDVTVESQGDDTTLKVVSDLKLTGRIASLGRGVQDVSNKLFSEFAANLAARLVPAPAGAPSPVADPARRTTAAADTPPVPPAETSTAPTGGNAGSIKLAPLVWSVTRERLASFLQRLSDRVRPPQ